MKSNRSLKVAIAAAMVALLAACSSVGPVNDAASAVASARTPEDHQKLSAYFDVKAKGYETEAAEHAKLADSYARYGNRTAQGAADHCRSLERKFHEAADEARSLAQTHRQLATGAQ